MNGLPNDLKAVAPGVHLDENLNTVYVRARGLAPSDLPGYVRRFRQELNDDPDNVGLRFLLATYLEMSGLHQEAQAELEQVAKSGDIVWAVKAQQMLALRTSKDDSNDNYFSA